MKLNVTPRANVDADTARWFREIASQVNALSEGKLSALYQAGQSAPIAGTFAQGDYVTNNNPVEAGTAGSQYVTLGWVCIAGGTPGTWLPSRTLTGN